MAALVPSVSLIPAIVIATSRLTAPAGVAGLPRLSRGPCSFLPRLLLPIIFSPSLLPTLSATSRSRFLFAFFLEHLEILIMLPWAWFVRAFSFATLAASFWLLIFRFWLLVFFPFIVLTAVVQEIALVPRNLSLFVYFTFFFLCVFFSVFVFIIFIIFGSLLRVSIWLRLVYSRFWSRHICFVAIHLLLFYLCRCLLIITGFTIASRSKRILLVGITILSQPTTGHTQGCERRLKYTKKLT
mmetsp:Transcript_9445/g.15283  ORF Transcript_9445/g.15283 Transcript_9445/m.15283 type:complete len:241 (-) Transcript_9445:2-724(-)